MTQEELKVYLDRLAAENASIEYIDRHFTAAKNEGVVNLDFDLRLSGILRDREPTLTDILKHPRVVILGEPGAGKSLVARAAVRELIKGGERVPIFSELKHYRGDLTTLLKTSAPDWIFSFAASAEGKSVIRAYVLDGVDEIPSEFLAQFGRDLEALLRADNGSSVFVTARQAFYLLNQQVLPDFTSVFHILRFSDEEIREYLKNTSGDADAFLQVVRSADATEEIRNPFVLSRMVKRFEDSGQLSPLRSDNISYIVDRLILSRPLVNQYRQRRALRLLAVAMETFARNELTETEALAVIQQSMRISNQEAQEILQELSNSILSRTINGVAFQMRSYGEYLAAEELADKDIDRLKELAFLDYATPIESWQNAVSYLAELNDQVRRFFVRKHPLWMVDASPSAFSDDEKDQIVRGLLEQLDSTNQYILRYMQLKIYRLGRFLTPKLEAVLVEQLASAKDSAVGNAIVLLSMRQNSNVLPVGMALVTNESLGDSLRLCGIIALINCGTPALLPEVLELLDKMPETDALHLNLLDLAGAISSESDIPSILPRILTTNGMPSAAFYHFREFKSREALVETLRYFAARPEDLNSVRASGYVEPILNLLHVYWDADIARLCVDVIDAVDARVVYPDPSGVARKLFSLIRDTDKHGLVARILLQKIGASGERYHLYMNQLLGSLMTKETAQWLIDKGDIDVIQQLSGYIRPGPIRELLRPYSGGTIDAQDQNAKADAAEQAEAQKSRDQSISVLQTRLLNTRDLGEALKCFFELTKSNWPELPAGYKEWLSTEVSRSLVRLDLGNSIKWEDDRLWSPPVVTWLLMLIGRYELRIDPDTPLIFCVTAWDEEVVAAYHRRFGLSSAARRVVEQLLENLRAPQAIDGVVRFLHSSQLWSSSIEAGVTDVVRFGKAKYCQIDALNLLVEHKVATGFLEEIAKTSSSEDVRRASINALVSLQHRPTIERGLSALLTNVEQLKSGQATRLLDTPIDWISSVRSEFAIPKLKKLRAKALQLALPDVVGLITGALVQINRLQAANIIKTQIAVSPESWRQAQHWIANEQERMARIEQAQNSPFEVVLGKLRGSTSLSLLKLVCEGSTDVPVFRELLAQLPNVPEIVFDSVGGWPNLCAKDPNSLQLGCKEAIVVMDGDLGRQLTKRRKPLTRMGKEQERRLSRVGVELRVLERYGIESYFPRRCLEKVLRKDLSAYFPIPDHISTYKWLIDSKIDWKYRLRKFLAARFHFHVKFVGNHLYSKDLNGEVSREIRLEDDLKGTDLLRIVHEIAGRARSLSS